MADVRIALPNDNWAEYTDQFYNDAYPARRTLVALFFDGVDITADMQKYLLSVSYTDKEDEETDDLQIKLQDRADIWTQKWLQQAVDAASLPTSKSIRYTYDTDSKARSEAREKAENAKRESNFRMQAIIIRRNWTRDRRDEALNCGEFFLDEISGTGAPNCITLKGSSAPYRANLRQSPVSKRWTNIHLGEIAKQIADKAGIGLMNLLLLDPYIDESTQNKESDAKYLSRLCDRFNVNLKFTNSGIVLYDGQPGSTKDPLEITKKDLDSYDFRVGKAQRAYDSCTVSYVTPRGTKFSGTAYVVDYDPENEDNLHLDLTIKCASNEEARKLSAYQLDRHNRYAMTGSISMAGNLRVVAGVRVKLSGFGVWNGLWAVSSASHTIDGSGGYTTKADLRKLDE